MAPEGFQSRHQGLTLGEELAMQRPPFPLEMGAERDQSVPARLIKKWMTGRAAEFPQEHLPILQIPQRDLRLAHLGRKGGCGAVPQLGGNFNGVAELLGCDPHLVKTLGDVQSSSLHESVREPSGTRGDALTQPTLPGLGILFRRTRDQLRENLLEFCSIEPFEPAQHPASTNISDAFHVLPGPQGAQLRNAAETLLGQQMQRHVHLSNVAQFASKGLHLPASLTRRVVKERDEFPQTARGHARPVQCSAVALCSGTQCLPQHAGLASDQCRERVGCRHDQDAGPWAEGHVTAV